MKKKIQLLYFFAAVFAMSWGQNPQNNQGTAITLEDCVAIALEHNIDLQTTKLQADASEVNYGQSRADLLPSLNANYNLGVTNGRSIDPFTNDYINQELTFSNAGVNLSATLFNGFRILNSIKQERFNLLASEMEIEENRQNLVLEVTLRYIQILNNLDALELAKGRLETTGIQLERLESHYKQQMGNPVDYTDMLGQSTLDEAEIIIAENNLKSAILELSILLNEDLDLQSDFQNILGLVASDKYPYSADEVYEESLQNLATFKSRAYRIDAADEGIKVARANFYPEISLFGQLNTNYSSLAQTFTETGIETVETGDYVDVSNTQYPVLRDESQFQGTQIDYGDQFNNNLNSMIGVAVRIPILNSFQAKNSVKLQKLQLEERELELENTKLQFRQAIEQAYNNMESAYLRYYIQLEQVAAYEESFRVNEVRFNNGISNIVDYITSKNNMDTAQLNLNRTKYEYLLRVKILDYYRGI